jgi:hypothetical protein
MKMFLKKFRSNLKTHSLRRSAATVRILSGLLLVMLVPVIGCTANASRTVLPSDELASHPKDPDRLTPGVDMDKIIPRLALEACTKAVKGFPSQARFHYQLGRALSASGRSEDAFRSFRKASEMGYRMAFFNLGHCYTDGEGTKQDMELARKCYRRASDLGVLIAAEQLVLITFSHEGFSNPEFFQAIYDGKIEENYKDSSAVATRLLMFLEPFEKHPEFSSLISQAAYGKIIQRGSCPFCEVGFAWS